MKKNIQMIILFILLLIIISTSGCTSLKVPQVSINKETFSGDDQILLKWDEIKNAESYKVSFYIYPLSENKLARSIELTTKSWEGVLPAGKYDAVVYAKKKSSLSSASNKITFTVENQSIPSWDDISFIFTSTNNQIVNKYGNAAFESDTGTSIIKSYKDPLMDLTYLDGQSDLCSQINIFDSRYILFGLSIANNTQADLISALNKNSISFENLTASTNAGSSKSTVFNYNKYKFIVYIDYNNAISFITIQK